MQRAAFAALFATLLPLSAAAQDVPSSVRNAARSAEAGYERAARWYAPTTFGGGAQECEEVVGRFCLTFDTVQKPPAKPERREVGAARLKAIDAVRRYFELAPNRLEAAAPLVRLLVEDRRPREAVAVARTYAQRGDSTTWREWLLGYALHANGEDSSAAVHFERALALLPASEGEEIRSIEWLIDADERARVRRLDPIARNEYVRRFWSVADPRLGTAVNEAFVQHVARHVEARMHARIPRVQGMMPWGRDLDQLTVRYGTPIARERVLATGPTGSDSYVEHFDTAALALAPRALLRDGLVAPAPGEKWRLAERAPRSAHVFASIGGIAPLAHQLTRYPRGDSMLLRIDLAADSARAAPAASAFVLDRGGRITVRTATPLDGATRTATLELLVPRDTLVYGAELYDPGSRRLYRARYAVEPLTAGDLQLSDLLLTEPLPHDSSAATPPALTDLRLPPDRELGVHAEVHGIRPGAEYEVAVAFARASRPSILARGVRWLGTQLGIARERVPARVAWLDRAGNTSTIAVNVTTPPQSGYWLLEVRIRTGSAQVTRTRLVHVLPHAR